MLRIPIGTGADGAPVELDLKEAAQDGMGPHGLVVGATGSGKSELLRTLVLGLAATHSPEVLNFVLVDFKGGATFASLDRLPHTSAVITNLADALPLVDRMHDAMSGELTRRQELLRRAGNFASVREYDRARAAGADLPPLASLLLVCDEFTEMLVAKPDLIDLFVQIGRIGRSIGVHLLLATQRLEEGRLRGLETNLSYRIALRTFTAHESRMTLGGASDAAELPASPGHGFLRVGTERAAAVQGGLRRPGRTAGRRRSRPAASRRTGSSTSPASTCRRRGPGRRPRRRSRPSRWPTSSWTASPVRGRPRTGSGCRRCRCRPTWTSCSAGWSSRPGRGVTTANPALWGALRVPIGDRRQAVRAAPGRGLARPGRGGRARRHRRQPAERQVHRGAHAGHRARAHPYAAARCRSTASTSAAGRSDRCASCRTWAGSPAGSTRRRSGARSARWPPC